jgi:hypothetical protein
VIYLISQRVIKKSQPQLRIKIDQINVDEPPNNDIEDLDKKI